MPFGGERAGEEKKNGNFMNANGGKLLAIHCSNPRCLFNTETVLTPSKTVS